MKNSKQKKQQGFTLIELMIVVAVIGVLAAIAIPQYQKYVEKSSLASALATASALKTNYEDYLAVSGAAPINISEIGAVSFALGSISISGGIAVEITEGGGKGSSVALARNTDGSWNCTISASKGVSINGCN
ncbi:TPA: type IV pilin protein [Vibrio diabolicus]|uniref:type IV pilin protein n=1 Tax=Vibrio TaxID=662 RepID=UPI001482C966|nr:MULTISPECIES: pilin [Vibrio]MCS0395057.1 pilin [Vibrio diabolicus]MDV5043106.1 pilin [Vibrio diabolicus]MDV5083842.1 pilin [Vibrio diabolicus]NNN54606.1 pilin [Vibrio sp. 1-2 (7-a)]